ncbi:gluconate 2-dehydrogenase subunit 3 family protein [Actinosynnema sp. NPDC023587]|uniref:gluconate 2-dehydrogenase subunit 3 family protein n=1 Tax=Actinosynnema sp. NPDC023587 TaxID=3154695 RepID=UPI0033C4320E
MTGPNRRQVMAAGAAAVPLTLLAGPPGHGTPARWRFFTRREAEVVVEATARLVPGPRDDPAEAGHPGAREADVVRYLDVLLSSVDFAPERVHAGGPWSDRAGGRVNHAARFVPLTAVRRIAWERRLGGWRTRYRTGLALLDRLAGGFTAAPASTKDTVLASEAARPFVDLLFEHTIEGMYGNPEYGGNRDLVGWRDIGFPGDSQPTGYSPAEVERSDGPDRVEPSPIVADFTAFLDNPPEQVAAALRRLRR